MPAAAAEDDSRRHRLQKVPFIVVQHHRAGLSPPPFEMVLSCGCDLREPAGGVQGLFGRHAGIDQAEPQGGGAVDVLARCRQFHGGPRSDQPCQANRASPARQQPQFHLGESQ
jgi:hypothetical protein